MTKKNSSNIDPMLSASEGSGPGPGPIEPVTEPGAASGDLSPELEVKPSTELLKVTLTSEELLELSKQLARSISEVGRLNDELTSVKSQKKAEIDKISATVNELSAKINSGYDWRKVDCEDIYNFQNNTVSRKRLDTGEIFNERTMSASERQRGLGLEEV
jgi:hypothetical protein